jgi:hypothetical protein
MSDVDLNQSPDLDEEPLDQDEPGGTDGGLDDPVAAMLALSRAQNEATLDVVQAIVDVADRLDRVEERIAKLEQRQDAAEHLFESWRARFDSTAAA